MLLQGRNLDQAILYFTGGNTRPQRRYTRSGGKASKVYQQYFRDEWLQLPEFSTWLRKDPQNLRKAICSFCQKSLNAKHSALLDHSKSEKHIKNSSEDVLVETVVVGGSEDIKSKKEQETIQTFLELEPDGSMPPEVQAVEEITESV